MSKNKKFGKSKENRNFTESDFGTKQYKFNRESSKRSDRRDSKQNLRQFINR